MAYSLWLILIVFGLLFSKSKIVNIIQYIFVFIVFAFNSWTPDYETYKIAYENIAVGNNYFLNYEVGYSTLMMLAKRIGLSYEEFRALLAVIVIFLIFSFLQMSVEHTAYVMSLCMQFPLLTLVSGVRACLSAMIVINAISFLQVDKRKFVAIMMVACLFHYSSIIYFLLLFNSHSDEKQFKGLLHSKFFYMIIIASICFYALFLQTDIGVHFISGITQRQKTLQWFSNKENAPNLTGIFTSIAVLLGTSFLVYEITQDEIAGHVSAEKYNVILTARNVAVFNIILIPALMLASTFMRIFYQTLPVLYAGLSESLLNHCEEEPYIIRTNFKLLEVIMIVWLIGIALFYDYGIFRGTDYGSFQVVADNYIWSLLTR